MAIAATYVITAVATGGTSASQLYTVPSTGYNRDLILTNAGTATIWAGVSTVGTVATSVASVQIPAGGSVILTQCQVPAGAVVSALSGVSATGLLSVGYGSVVSVI